VKTNDSEAYTDALQALGDPTRRAVFERLADRPSAVVDLAAALPVSRPAVSQHLKVLKEAGLVRDVQVGTRRVYSLHPEGLAGLRDYLDRFWNTALASFKARVESGAPVPEARTARNDHTTRNSKRKRRSAS
jgi:DNA-binding transcriptional ArsR family regulator